MANKEKTYGEAMQELQQIMQLIEDEELDVDILLVEVKKATALIKYCKEQLTKTNGELQKMLDSI